MNFDTESFTTEEINEIHKYAMTLSYRDAMTQLSDGYIMESKALSRVLESTCCKILSYILHLSDWFDYKKEEYPEYVKTGWFYCDVDHMEFECGLTERQQAYALEKLVNDNLLEVRYDKTNRRQVRLNKSKIMALIIGCTNADFNPFDFDDPNTSEMKSLSNSKIAKKYAKLYDFGILQNVESDMLTTLGLVSTKCRYIYNIKHYIFYNINKYIKIYKENNDKSEDLLEMKKQLIQLENEIKEDLKKQITGTKQQKKTTQKTKSKQPKKNSEDKVSEEIRKRNYMRSAERYISETLETTNKQKLTKILDWLDVVWEKGIQSTKHKSFIAACKQLEEIYKKCPWEQVERILDTCIINQWREPDWAVPKWLKNKYNNTRTMKCNAVFFDAKDGETAEEYSERKIREREETIKNLDRDYDRGVRV